MALLEALEEVLDLELPVMVIELELLIRVKLLRGMTKEELKVDADVVLMLLLPVLVLLLAGSTAIPAILSGL